MLRFNVFIGQTLKLNSMSIGLYHFYISLIIRKPLRMNFPFVVLKLQTRGFLLLPQFLNETTWIEK